MKTAALVVQGVLVALLGLALWRYVVRGSALGHSTQGAEERGAVESRSASVPSDAPVPSTSASSSPTPAVLFVDPASETSYKAGVLRIPLEGVRPLAEGRWVLGASHFVLEEVGERRCVLALGELVRIGDAAVSLRVDGKPRASALARYARELGLALRHLLVPPADFRARWAKGLPECAKWILHTTPPEAGPLPDEPIVLKQGARKGLPREGLVSARVVSGTSVVLERKALEEGYVVHAIGTGESLLALERLPGPHVRRVRVVVKPRPARATVSKRATPHLPPPSVFVVPGWTSRERRD